MKVKPAVEAVVLGNPRSANLLTGCSNSRTLDVGTSTNTSASRLTALHPPPQWLRSHGVPNFADPVLGANGQVFTGRAGPPQTRREECAGRRWTGARSNCGSPSWNPETQHRRRIADRRRCSVRDLSAEERPAEHERP